MSTMDLLDATVERLSKTRCTAPLEWHFEERENSPGQWDDFVICTHCGYVARTVAPAYDDGMAGFYWAQQNADHTYRSTR